jgi:DNA-binding HxlR family transcriptional regulator
MFRYGQFCPISKAVEVIGERWSLLVVRELALGRRQFSELQRALPRISPTTLSKRLAELQASGLVLRKRIPAQQGFEYVLTASGREVMPLVIGIGEWGMRWARGRMDDDELDVVMLMDDVERRIVRSQLPAGLSVLRFKFTDVDEFADWWIKIDDEGVELCEHDPGYDVDVYFTTDIRTMVEVWMGDVSLARARSSGKLRVVGRTAYLRNLSAWLPLHSLARIRPAAGYAR